MSENLEVFREVWSMHLSATRNRIIRINLGVTVASFALTACIVPASFFGMNLPSGLGQLEHLSIKLFVSLPHMKQHEHLWQLGRGFAGSQILQEWRYVYTDHHNCILQPKALMDEGSKGALCRGAPQHVLASGGGICSGISHAVRCHLLVLAVFSAHAAPETGCRHESPQRLAAVPCG